MDNSVTYSVIPRKNPKDQDSPAKFYACARARGEASIRSMAAQIERMCTLTHADIVGVLVALESTVCDSLANGEIVRLGDLCSLQLGVNSRSALTAKEFNPSLITKAHVNFRPGYAIKHMLGGLSYERVKSGKEEAMEEAEAKGPDAHAEEPGA